MPYPLHPQTNSLKPNERTQHVFRAVIVAKLSYAWQARSGFTSAADLQRLNAFLRRSIRQGFCSPELTDITVIFGAAHETLFHKIVHLSSNSNVNKIPRLNWTTRLRCKHYHETHRPQTDASIKKQYSKFLSKSINTVKIQLSKHWSTRSHCTINKVWILQPVPCSQRTCNAVT